MQVSQRHEHVSALNHGVSNARDHCEEFCDANRAPPEFQWSAVEVEPSSLSEPAATAHRIPLFQAPAGTRGRTRVTAALCRTVDFQERLVQIAAFAQNPSSYAVGDGDEIHRDERAHLAFLDEPLRAIAVIPSPLPKFHQDRSIRLGSDALMGMALT